MRHLPPRGTTPGPGACPPGSLLSRSEREADMDTSIDRAGCLVNGYGQMLLADLKSSGDAPRPSAFSDATTGRKWSSLSGHGSTETNLALVGPSEHLTVSAGSPPIRTGGISRVRMVAPG